MTFAQELDQELVPEWRTQYLNYKIGKRYVKTISRAIHRKTRTPHHQGMTLCTNPFTPNHRHGHRASSNSDNGIPFRRGPASMRGGLVDDIITASSTNGRTPLQGGHNEGSRAEGSPSYETEEAYGEWESTLSAFYSPVDTYPPPAPTTATHNVMFQLTEQSGLPQRLTNDELRCSLKPLAIPLEPARTLSKADPTSALDTATPGRLWWKRTFKFARSQTHKFEARMHPTDIVHLREEFFGFMDGELEKVETFYQQKQQQAGKRLVTLRQQLHIMRARRTQEPDKSMTLPIKSKIVRPGRNSEALQALSFPPILPKEYREPDRDYTKKSVLPDDVSYRTAKHKLKLAIQEFYRGLESVLLDEYMEAAEDLYTSFFERGNRKLAVAKLRKLSRPRADQSESAFVNGALIGVGLTFAIEGVVLGFRKLSDQDPDVRQQTSYLLQIYAGYFLMLYLFAWFCLNCRIWTAYKVNYPFIFEFDPRHDLDWRQLSEFPSFFTLVFGIFVWLNFSDFGSEKMFIYYPVLLIFITLCVIFLPLPILRWRSRRWFAYAHWRLFCAGLFSVEFRDFFLGDMYCSLVYTVANAELFFCLYAVSWEDPIQCDSKNSRLLGFLVALPPIWRALQCIRRFWDTGNAFPHLANLLKYVMTIMTAITLSMYRVGGTQLSLYLFIAFSSINSFYGFVWDLFMDFSLLQQGAHHTGLRDTMAFNQRWLYYGIIVIDPILRFSWIFLAILTHNVQHGSIVAFLVAFAEVTRRGMWALFRVENEYCTNICQQKASREVSLPYRVEEDAGEDIVGIIDSFNMAELQSVGSTAQPQHQLGDATSLIETGRVRLREYKSTEDFAANGILRGLSRILSKVHRQDFQKRWRWVDTEPSFDRGIQQALPVVGMEGGGSS